MFPSAASVPSETTDKSLFPLAHDKSIVRSDGAKNKQFDWLQNSSFKKEDAKLLTQIQQAQDRSSINLYKYENIDTVTLSTTTTSDSVYVPEASSRLQGDCYEHQNSDSRDTYKSKKKKKHKKYRKKVENKDERGRALGSYSESNSVPSCANVISISDSDSPMSEAEDKKFLKKKRHKKDKKFDRDSKKQKTVDANNRTHAMKLEDHKKIFLEDFSSNFQKSCPFRIDKKPDHNNLIYGSIYKGHIPKYKCRFTSCLGDPKFNCLFSRKNSKKKYDDGRYHSKPNQKLVRSQNVEKHIPDRVKNNKVGNACDYISVPDDVAPSVEKSESNPLGIYDSSTASYAGGFDSGVKKMDVDEDVLVEANPMRVKVAEYNSYLKTHPQDIDRWIEFVHYQDDVVSADSISTSASNLKRSIVDIQLSILKRAQILNPKELRLKLLQLKLAATVWDVAKLRDEWTDILESSTYRRDADAWRSYLTFLRCSLVTFSVAGMIEAYVDCIAVFSAMQTYSKSAVHHLQGFFSQLCMLLCQCGHTEMAVTLCQAQIEFNLCCPAMLVGVRLKQKLEILCAFWGSMAPRIGETNSLGWDIWVERKGDVENVAMHSTEQEEKIEEQIIETEAVQGLNKCWMRLEQSRVKQCWLPWRPDYNVGEVEDDCEDVDRIVALDDLQNCLYDVKFPRESGHDLGMVFLYFNLIGVEKVPQRWCSNNQSFHEYQIHHQHHQVHNMKTLTVPATLVLDQSICETIINNCLQQIGVRLTQTHNTYFTVFVMNHHLCQAMKCYTDAKVFKRKGKELKKWCKNMLSLSSNRTNVILWSRYGVIMWCLGFISDAQKAFDTIIAVHGINVQSKTDPSDKRQGVLIYRLYVELKLGLYRNADDTFVLPDSDVIKDNSSVLTLLICLADNESYSAMSKQPVSGIKTLKALQIYREQLEVLLCKFIDQPDDDIDLWTVEFEGFLLCHWTACYALLEYLTTGIHAALEIYDYVIDIVKKSLPNKSSDTEDFDLRWNYFQLMLESLYSSYINLMQYHSKHHVYPLHKMRQPLNDAVKLFPDHHCFTHTFVRITSAANIAGLMWRQISSVIRLSNTSALWLELLLAEFKRKDNLAKFMQQSKELFGRDSSNLLSLENTPSCAQLRRYLSKAVQSTTGSQTLELWRIYMATEMLYGTAEQVQSVFYQAVNSCPSGKCLYMDYVGYFPDRVLEVMDLMLEKELRIRTPIEEVELLLANHSAASKSDLQSFEDIEKSSVIE